MIVDVAELLQSTPGDRLGAEVWPKDRRGTDILTGWDFTKDEHKRMAKEYIDKGLCRSICMGLH